ncbi:hypothetical protein J421_5251 (plasmid) [Gemmatirosa kalamazoonensis]|jgi:hypothetical protein|uniref:Uncharacterized protein n=1 Tax=Gemmatirosa kalamazoonensis TaxID=861299 RepID=W0RQ10_9BACT|nr:hypothetical protein [Gemmatirosa kalamazoonensis]AHG92786.1 hypothetical protein J421_5251 [Gemmatirosa kalamazoonensis]
MKGGKKGRDPKPGGGRPPGGRGKPKPTPGKRPAGAPPPKGSRKRPGYGGSSSAGDE